MNGWRARLAHQDGAAPKIGALAGAPGGGQLLRGARGRGASRGGQAEAQAQVVHVSATMCRWTVRAVRPMGEGRSSMHSRLSPAECVRLGTGLGATSERGGDVRNYVCESGTGHRSPEVRTRPV